MTHCPNPECNRRLRLRDWRQTCPGCGVNLLYYRMEERLEEEADRNELEAAVTQKTFDRIRAATIGSRLAQVRLALLFLPVLALLAPMARLTLSDGSSVWLGLIGLIQSSDAVLALRDLWFLLALAGLVIALAAFLAGLITCCMACGPKWFLRALLINGAGFGGAAFAGIALSQLSYAALSPGVIALPLAFLILLAINMLIKSKGGLQVNYKPCYIAGLPEEDVLAALEQGKTVRELREAKAACP